MAKHVASMLAIAAGLLAGSGGALRAQEKMTIGISYQNLAFPYRRGASEGCGERLQGAWRRLHRGRRGQRH